MKRLILTLLIGAKLSGYFECQLGPEVFSYNKSRESGSYQNGRLDGLRIRLERFKAFGFYLGADYLTSIGDIKGKSSRGDELFSQLSDDIYDVRLGFCLCVPMIMKSFFVPFIGYGHLIEINKAYLPQDLQIRALESSDQLLIGFVSWVEISCLYLGLRYTSYWMQNANCKITEDPDFDDCILSVKEVPYIRIEIPLRLRDLKKCINWQLTPFYEYRHFGSKEGYPFDYIDTKFHNVGGNFSIVYAF